MSWETFTKIVDEASEHGPRSFSLHLFGEPLLWGRIREGILYIKQKNKRHSILLTTNGILLNEYAEFLVESGVDKIIWTFRRLGGNRFTDKTIQALRKIGTLRILKETMSPDDWEEAKRIKWNREVKSLHNYGGTINADQPHKKRYACYHLWFAPAISWDGSFLICCNDPDKRTSLGDIKTGIANHWLWMKMWNLRWEHKIGEYTGICKECNCWASYPRVF